MCRAPQCEPDAPAPAAAMRCAMTPPRTRHAAPVPAVKLGAAASGRVPRLGGGGGSGGGRGRGRRGNHGVHEQGLTRGGGGREEKARREPHRARNGLASLVRSTLAEHTARAAVEHRHAARRGPKRRHRRRVGLLSRLCGRPRRRRRG